MVALVIAGVKASATSVAHLLLLHNDSLKRCTAGDMSESISQTEQAEIDRAIALSLSHSNGTSQTPILLESSSEDDLKFKAEATADDSETEISDVEELARRVAARRVAGQKRTVSVANSSNGNSQEKGSKKVKTDHSNASSCASLDAPVAEKQNGQPAFLTRAQMERERLARQASREEASVKSSTPKTGFMPSSTSSASKYGPRVATLSSVSSESQAASASTSTSQAGTSSSGFASLSTLRTDRAKRRYWQGVLVLLKQR